MMHKLQVILDDGMLLTWVITTLILGELIMFAILSVAKKSLRKTRWTSPGACYFTLCLGLFVLSTTSLLSYSGTHERLHRLEVALLRSGAVRDVVAEIMEMEVGERGYLLTGLADQLVPYRRGRDSIKARCRVLDEAFRDHEDRRRAEALCKLVQVRADEIERTIALSRGGDVAGARSLMAKNEDVGTMEMIRVEAEELAGRADSSSARTRENIQSLSDVRVGMAILITAGSIIQMILGAFINLHPFPPPAPAPTPPA